MSHDPAQSRARVPRVLLIVWIALISGLVLLDHVTVSRLTARVEQNIDHLVLLSVEEKVASLEPHVEALQGRPIAVTQESFSSAQQTLEDRLVQVEQVVRDAAPTSLLLSLQDRLDAIEKRLARVRTKETTAPTPEAAAVHLPSAPPDPPFTVLGVDQRGGKFFLSLAPAGAYSLDAVRVLQPGETFEDWQLESVDGEAAVFRVAGRSQRVTVR